MTFKIDIVKREIEISVNWITLNIDKTKLIDVLAEGILENLVPTVDSY